MSGWLPYYAHLLNMKISNLTKEGVIVLRRDWLRQLCCVMSFTVLQSEPLICTVAEMSSSITMPYLKNKSGVWFCLKRTKHFNWTFDLGFTAIRQSVSEHNYMYLFDFWKFISGTFQLFKPYNFLCVKVFPIATPIGIVIII